jgi:hypothetical protein
MPNCSEMKKGEVYVCGTCGMELQVIKECSEESSKTCDLSEDECCNFSCCGAELKKKH